MFEVNVTSRSTRLVQVGDDPATRFKERLTLTSSLPVVSEMHNKLLPSLAGVSVILDQTMWQTIGHVWCKLLLEGRVRVQSLTIVNNMGQGCMRDFGEVAGTRDEDLAYHSQDTNVGFQVDDNTLSFTKSEGGALGDRGDDTSEFSAGFGDDFDSRLEPGSSSEHLEFEGGATFEGGQTFEGGATPKPVTLYSWVNCGFCKKQDAIIEACSRTGRATARRSS